jgi:hypothetical protein
MYDRGCKELALWVPFVAQGITARFVLMVLQVRFSIPARLPRNKDQGPCTPAFGSRPPRARLT